ncbi:MAG TPA: quinoprotein dehydrogenase-associated putative ABC transporter substrate-binding protein [Acidobacteriaceae bacterium]|nr:quinoprotein dehydrogenase-associated putative ABC transporter substrate-binding protein [Acidobacteriaceae bacterium]
MSSRFLSAVAIMCAVMTGTIVAESANAPLRICADPDNPPYSVRDGSGFDNRIAVVIAKQLGRKPVFVWARERRGFIREQFNKNACDVLMGVPVGMRSVMTTQPYYRSTYVFVTRAQDRLQLASFSDPKLDHRRIGLQIMEEDLSPPSLPLIRSGHAGQLVGFESFGAHAANIVSAVADHRVDVAVVWGPLAGFYAARRGGLVLKPVAPQVDAGIPFTFALAVGVHKSDVRLREQIDEAIRAKKDAITAILTSYHVPLLPLDQGGRQ